MMGTTISTMMKNDTMNGQTINESNALIKERYEEWYAKKLQIKGKIR